MYAIKQHNLGKYYFDAKSLQLVANLPDTSKNKPQGNVLLFGSWGFRRIPCSESFR